MYYNLLCGGNCVPDKYTAFPWRDHLAHKDIASVHLTHDEEAMLETLAHYFQCDKSMVVKLAIESLYESVTELELSTDIDGSRIPDMPGNTIRDEMIN
jgi:hypothetical protein